MVRSVDIFSREDMERVVKRWIEKDMEGVYEELGKLRNKMIDLDNAFKGVMKYWEERDNDKGKRD